MKRKPAPPSEPVVPKQILDEAKRAVHADTIARAAKCVVCGSERSANATDELCWVCRRLKISAWHDSDQQASAQE